MCTYSLVPITLASQPTKPKDATEIRVQRCQTPESFDAEVMFVDNTITTHRLTCRPNDKNFTSSRLLKNEQSMISERSNLNLNQELDDLRLCFRDSVARGVW